MKIRFGTALTAYHLCGTLFLGCIVFAIGWYSMDLQTLIGESEESILRSRGLNVTRIPTVLRCDLPYDNCLCSVLSKKPNITENCITYYQLAVSRILPLVSFLLQICLVQQLFSFSSDYRHVIIFVLWITSIFIFIGMIISIYQSSCYHAYIAFTLFVTVDLLCYLSFHNVTVNIDRIPSSHGNRILPVYTLKLDHHASVGWEELP